MSLQTRSFILYASWTIALAAMMVSLIFSEILKFPPCTLCWYQRVFMYPIVFILPVGILLKDRNISKYVLILSGVGVIIAGYHSLIYHGIIPEAIKVCTAELSCKTKQFELFNFLSIPVMSFLSFAALFGLNSVGVNHVERS